MFVISVEGPAYVNKGTWATHKVLGVHATREEALANPEAQDMDDEDILIVTDTTTGHAERIHAAG